MTEWLKALPHPAELIPFEPERARRSRASYGEDETCTTQEFELEVSGKRSGLPACTQSNIALALAKLGIVVRYDRFADRELVQGLDGFGPHLDDAAMVRLLLLIDERFLFRPAKEFFHDVISDRARHHSFHPVCDYLASLQWDGAPRIGRWLVEYGGADDSELTCAVGRIVLIAAVRRVRQPGVKYDEMVVLESMQGTNKSSALAVLAVRPEWFTDDLPLAADTKRQMEALSGKWIVEAGELKGMSKVSVADLKSLLSRQVDEARMAYGRKSKCMPRQCVIIGTTNELAGYLKDSTGNRRFWPVQVRSFDLDGLRRDRDQLWAEAASAEASNESIRLDPKFYAAASIEQDARRLDDPILMVLHRALGVLTGKLRTLDALKLVGVEGGKASQDQMQRLGEAMRELGWERTKRRFGSSPEYAYVRGTQAERERELIVSGAGETAHACARAPRASRT